MLDAASSARSSTRRAASTSAYVVGQDECRFRVSLFKQRGRLSLVRGASTTPSPTSRTSACPTTIEKLCNFPEGLVILAGVTGSGKSTTIASMLDYIDEREPLHILTVEDPIEFTFTDKKAYINQREIGLDVHGLAQGAQGRRAAGPRRDPRRRAARRRDVRGGRPRGRDGPPGVRHHPRRRAPATTINRILDLFPPEKHAAIRKALANNLKAIVAQKLVKGLKKAARADQRDHDRQPDRSRS